MDWKKKVGLGLVLLLLAAGVAWAQNIYGIRDDAGTTATQPTAGNLLPIRISTNSLGHVWVADGGTAAPVAKTLTLVTKEVAASGTGVPLVASQTFARKVILMAKKATGANTGLVYIGTSTVDATTPQQIALAPGDSITIDPGPGCKVDLATIYIDCAAGNTDGVTGWYFPI